MIIEVIHRYSWMSALRYMLDEVSHTYFPFIAQYIIAFELIYWIKEWLHKLPSVVSYLPESLGGGGGGGGLEEGGVLRDSAPASGLAAASVAKRQHLSTSGLCNSHHIIHNADN